MGQSAARIASAQAALASARADEARVATLVREGWAAQARLDTSRAALREAEAAVQEARAAREIATENVTSVEVGRGGLEANVESAQAALELALIDLSNTRVLAPRTGRLGEVGVRAGQYVTAGTQLMSVVPSRVWVVANLKEGQLDHVRSGQSATVRVDALGDAVLRAHVARISPAAGSEFSVIRPDNATGNFVKVAQRIPVRLEIDPGQPLAQRLRPGMSVVAAIDTAPR